MEEAPVGQFADYLRTAMHCAGYRRASQLAEAAGVPQPNISRWLSGKAVPSLELLRQISPCIKIPLPDLLVVSGQVTREEIGLTRSLILPGPPPTVEDDIRSDPDLADEVKDAMIAILNHLRANSRASTDAQQSRRA